MERVTGTEPTIEVFENDIQLYLEQFKEEQNIEDYKTVPQSVWNGALRYVYNHVFKPNPDILKNHDNYNINNNIMPSTYNAYNYKLLLEIADYYIYSMCMVNNKEDKPQSQHFCRVCTNIPFRFRLQVLPSHNHSRVLPLPSHGKLF